jgi:hypothetical protein
MMLELKIQVHSGSMLVSGQAEGQVVSTMHTWLVCICLQESTCTDWLLLLLLPLLLLLRRLHGVPTQANPSAPSHLQPAYPTASNPNGGFGGALYVTGSLQTYLNGRTGVTFTNNSALMEGGAVQCSFCSYLSFNKASFQSNTARSGGALGMDHVLTSSLLSDNRFVGNAAMCPEGAAVVSAVAANNSAATAAAAAAAATSAADASSNSDYTCGCGGGGAVCVKSTSMLSLARNVFLENRAFSGGAMQGATDPPPWIAL